MKIIEATFPCVRPTDTYTFYVIGDTHVGARNCAEDKLRVLVDIIAADPNARWFGGGDLCDNVILPDTKRFDPTVLPTWMLDHRDADDVAEALQDIAGAQKQRLFDILEPIKDKCLGLIEGNHEYAIMKHHNRDFMKELCQHFDAPNLTDCAFVRLRFNGKFRSGSRSEVVRMFITHGYGGGRTTGAETNRLYRLAADKEVDIVLCGHSHSFALHPPIPMLSVPCRGDLPENAATRYKYAANWGSLVYTYQSGPSTYASRANYPVRPMYTVETSVTPFGTVNGESVSHIGMQQIHL